jgi:hypothetical protein
MAAHRASLTADDPGGAHCRPARSFDTLETQFQALGVSRLSSQNHLGAGSRAGDALSADPQIQLIAGYSRKS